MAGLHGQGRPLVRSARPWGYPVPAAGRSGFVTLETISQMSDDPLIRLPALAR